MKNTNENSKRKNRFEGRTTVVKGQYVDMENNSVNDFEVTVDYVRAEAKAAEMAFEALNLADSCIINTRTLQVINEAPKPIRYNNGKLVDFAVCILDNENEAIEACADGQIVKQVSIYTVESVIWSVTFGESENEYHTVKVAYNTSANITKADARAFVRMKYEQENGDSVLAMHDTKKSEHIMYAVMFENDLEKCIIPDKDETK